MFSKRVLYNNNHISNENFLGHIYFLIEIIQFFSIILHDLENKKEDKYNLLTFFKTKKTSEFFIDIILLADYENLK